eukprot:SAG31_NODE_2300_length_5980_cov_17.062744_1_plen_131_part_00
MAFGCTLLLTSSASISWVQGGDAPQNRRQEYKKQQKREAGGREGRERQADGKPVHVKGIGTYQKPAPAFVETMLAAYAKKNQADPATAKMSGGIEAIMGISDGRSERDQVRTVSHNLAIDVYAMVGMIAT